MKAHEIVNALCKDGWKTPNTYCNHFDAIPPASGVYLFLKATFGNRPDFGGYRILYVGKSTNLVLRLNGHEILAMIRRVREKLDIVQKWFKPMPADQIDEEEIRLIRRFNPPYNIAHRVRGA